MKQLTTLFLLALSLSASAQTLDTVSIKNFTLRAQDWSYCIGQFYTMRSDTVANDFIDQYRAKIKAAVLTAGWNTPVTVDSIPGHIAFKIYMIYKTAPAGESELLGSNISAVINAVTHPTFSAAIQAYNANITASFQAKRADGKRFSLGK